MSTYIHNFVEWNSLNKLISIEQCTNWFVNIVSSPKIFTSSKSTIQKPNQCEKYVQS